MSKSLYSSKTAPLWPSDFFSFSWIFKTWVVCLNREYMRTNPMKSKSPYLHLTHQLLVSLIFPWQSLYKQIFIYAYLHKSITPISASYITQMTSSLPRFHPQKSDKTWGNKYADRQTPFTKKSTHTRREYPPRILSFFSPGPGCWLGQVKADWVGEI